MNSTDTHKKMPAVAVWCASTPGSNTHQQFADLAGKTIANLGIELVYGGTTGGLMTVLAESAYANGGTLTGISLTGIEKSETFPNLKKHIITKTLGERKEKMASLADAFLILPGGLGTLDEFIEAFTKVNYLGLNKPILLVNPENYWAPLLSMFDTIAANGYIDQNWRKHITLIQNAASMIQALQTISNKTNGGKNGNKA